MNILILTASPGKNLELAKSLQEIIPDNVTSELIDLSAIDLALYTPQAEEGGTPQLATELFKKTKNANGFITLAPEYNGGLPPTLTNYISWMSRSGGKDWREAFNNKICLLGTHSGSGGTNVLNGMRIQMSYIGCHVMGRMVHTHYQKALNPESAEAVIGEFTRLLS